MEPISLIVTALVAGAAAGLQPMAETAIKDAYAGIKRLIQDKYNQVDLDLLEKNPTSKGRQVTVKEELEQTDAGQDVEVLRHAKILLDAIRQSGAESVAESVAAAGIITEDVEAASLEIEDIITSGTAVNMTRTKVTGNIKIKNIKAGQQRTDPKP